MRQFFAVLILCFLAVSAHAAELVWDAQTITSPLTVEQIASLTARIAVGRGVGCYSSDAFQPAISGGF